MTAPSSYNQICCCSFAIEILIMDQSPPLGFVLYYIPILLHVGLPVCALLVFSLYFVCQSKFLPRNAVFKVPELKKKVPEKKVAVPKKEEAPPAPGTATPRQTPHCHFFLSPVKAAHFNICNTTHIVAVSIVIMFVKPQLQNKILSLKCLWYLRNLKWKRRCLLLLRNQWLLQPKVLHPVTGMCLLHPC